jgi:hypothetical protein
MGKLVEIYGIGGGAVPVRSNGISKHSAGENESQVEFLRERICTCVRSRSDGKRGPIV